MKNKLEAKDLKKVSGGYILFGTDDSYWVCGRNDRNEEVNENFGKNFKAALKYEWENFKEQYKLGKMFYIKEGLVIKDIESLERFYSCGNFYMDSIDLL